jgi:hypothetical protein
MTMDDSAHARWQRENTTEEKTHYLAYLIYVESGRIVQSDPRSPDLERKTLEEFSRWVESVGGWIYPLSPAGWHTCADRPNVPCGACESVNHPSERISYNVMLKRERTPRREKGNRR